MAEEHRDALNSVTTVKWAGSKVYDCRRREMHPHVCDASDIMLFQNVKKLVLINKPSENDLIWQLFENQRFKNNLEHLMMSTDFEENLLFSLYKFKELKTLKLNLSFSTNSIYNRELMNLLLQSTQHMNGCLNLNTVSLRFVFYGCSSVADEMMNNIWNYVLTLTPNLTDYSFTLNGNAKVKRCESMHHLIGHYHQLQSLTVPSPKMLQHITSNIMNLRKLIISVHSKKSFNKLIANNHLKHFEYLMANNHLKHFPNLESFAFIFEKRLRAYDRKIDKNLNESVVRLFEYLVKQRPPKLQYITLCNQDCVETAKRIAKHASSGKDFDCDKEISQRICKLIIALVASTDMNIETIALSPVILRKQEIDYLDFWFGDGVQFGCIRKTLYAKKRNISLMVIVITNKQHSK